MARYPAIRYLQATSSATGVTDAELGRRYFANRDEAAFELLVRRHADLVWAACRRVLPRDHQAAEDAFQATFLALSRRCGSVRSASAAGWLYRVAVRAALRLRARTPVLSPIDRAGPDTGPDTGETVAVVHQELDRLADKYRLPVLLCDLKGLNHAEAAAQLGWPVGTVSGRLSIARDLLRNRLVRRGLAPVLGAIAVIPMGETPASLIQSSISLAAGGAVPRAVDSLATGVLSAMRWAKIKLFAGAFTGVVTLAGVASLAVSQDFSNVGKDPASQPPAPAKNEIDPQWNLAVPPSAFPDLVPGRQHPAIAKVVILKTDTPLKKLQKARLNLLLTELEVINQATRQGSASASDGRMYYPKLAAAAMEVFDKPAELRPWIEAWVVEMKAEEQVMAQRVGVGAVSQADLFIVRRGRLDAEIALAKLGPR